MLMHQLLIESAARRPDAIAFRWIDRNVALTYEQACAMMENMAGALSSLGVRKGDRVTVFAHNGMDYLISMLGAWRIGAICALVNVKFADSLSSYVADHTPSVLIYTHDMVDVVRKAAKDVPGISHLVCMDGPQEGSLSLPQLLEACMRAPIDPSDESAIAHLSYTSGTTGKPKGACLAHEPTVRAVRCIGERLQIRSGDISFGPTALSSSYQLVANLLPALAMGASANVMGQWSPQKGWDAMESLGATAFVANPTLLEELLVECRVRGKPPGHLRYGLSGGGAVPPSLKAAWRNELSVPLVESFGQSELGGFMALGYPILDPDDAHLFRVGPPLPDKEIRIVDATDTPLKIGQVGEIVLRGGYMAGYWNMPEKTKAATEGGWLRTGDIGLIDKDGSLTMRGRRSELIDVAGVRWFPRDVEEALCQVKGVRQAALIGIPDAAIGMRPCAFVTMASEVVPDVQGMRQFIEPMLSYDLRHLSIVVLSELPMTPTGKIAKAQLIELILEKI